MSEQIYAEAVLTFGADTQLAQCIEECAELIAAINRYRRGRISENALVKEIADVEIMIGSMRVMFGDDPINMAKFYKLTRLRKRIDRADDKI